MIAPGGGSPGASPPATLGGDPASARLVPSVCGEMSWTSVADPGPKAALAVAGDATRAAVLAVPRAGGTIVGFTIDLRSGQVTSNAKLALGDPSSSVAVASIGAPYVAAAIDASGASPVAIVERLAPDLSQPTELGRLAGGVLAEPALVPAGRGSILPVAGDAGVTFAAFGADGQETSKFQVATTEPVTGLTATRSAGDALVAWSTAHTCSFTALAAPAPGAVTTLDGPCASPRLAADAADGTRALVYTAPDGTLLLRYFAQAQLARGAVPLRPDARAPRIAFDGSRYWVSYIGPKGDVVVGFLDAGQHLISGALIGTRPQDEAYQLVMLGNRPWLFALDQTGYSAHELCALPQS